VAAADAEGSATMTQEGDVQLTHEFGVSTLNIKVNPEGPNFSVRVDGVHLLPQHINFFHSD